MPTEIGLLWPAAINKFVSFFNTSELSLKLPVTGFTSFAYLLRREKKITANDWCGVCLLNSKQLIIIGWGVVWGVGGEGGGGIVQLIKVEDGRIGGIPFFCLFFVFSAFLLVSSKMAVQELKAYFNRCWQEVNYQTPRQRICLKRFSQMCLLGLIVGGEGRRGSMCEGSE